MSGGAKRNSDKLNTIGIVVVGICGAALVHVSITLLQAFYMSDSSDVQTMADYGGQDTAFQRTRADELGNITQCVNQMGAAGGTGASTHKIQIEDAMRLVVEDARRDPAMLVPQFGRADKPTIKAKFDRPEPLDAPAPAPAAPTDPAAPAPAAGDAAAPGAAAAAPAAAGVAPAVAPATAGGTVPGAAASATPPPATPPPAR
jgi:hypothetical protein